MVACRKLNSGPLGYNESPRIRAWEGKVPQGEGPQTVGYEVGKKKHGWMVKVCGTVGMGPVLVSFYVN